MYNDTYVPGAYLDLAPSKPFATHDTGRKMQMEMNGQWMKNKNLPLMRPNATWTWLEHNLAFKSMVVPVPKGRVTSKNVLILDTPRKIQLMKDHFPQWLIDNHCVFRAAPDLPFKPIDPPPLELPEQARIHKYRKPDWKNALADGKCVVHETVEAPNGEMVTLEYSTPSERLEQIRKFERMKQIETAETGHDLLNALNLPT